ncbi:MAG: threonine--tRNA ligase [Syntrophobacteria bacterium]|jgi:threonyl-tRNA synthetase|nr:threonine--tRNA ligase [Deltaproteobacteria bacterium]MDH3849950.1 threonine--tRNA ligase [Deltaproteobacteria bacterium]MDH3951272.1 threonine--tRNA ligase [Deltaproteobacteria bacterium]
MDEINVSIGSGESQRLPKGISAGEALERLRVKKGNPAVAAKINGELVDLSRPLEQDCTIEPLNQNNEETLEILRHTASHVMAQAVQSLYPEAKITIGPAIENGFYYDFDYPETFSVEDIPQIEAKMQEIIQQATPVFRRELDRQEAIRVFTERNETYKVEMLEEMDEPVVSVYGQDDWLDLCRGPHLVNTSEVKAFKLTGVAGAYWRGDERNPMLQRIYGTAFFSKKDLKRHLQLLEEAKKRDHRKLGKELDLFHVSDEAGPGLVIYHPKGALLRHIIETFEKEAHLRRGYQMVSGPQLLKTEMWKKSGHFENYRENMYFTEVEGQSYGIKPMNCLAHMLIYKSTIRSYRDLPIRYFEMGLVHRHEKSGVLHGLTRVRQFTQDDAHLICTPEQLNDEIKGVIDFALDMLQLFGFEYEIELSTQPEKRIGTDEDWERATVALEKALTDKRIPYKICAGEGAFYGPKIDILLKDALNRRWQCSTIQCDFTLPERFDLTYIGPDGGKHRPVMLHRTLLGSMERFLGVLIEHYAGAFPTWLAPVQAIILTVTDRHQSYGEELYKQLLNAGIRVERDLRNEKLGYKIREAQLQKIPYMLVVGDREVEAAGISPRRRDGKDLKLMEVADFVELVREENAVTDSIFKVT